MVRHLYGYDDSSATEYEELFDFYQVVGCRKNSGFITPCSKKDSPTPYYRDYSECHQSRLYFRGFRLSELRSYANEFRKHEQCVGCTHPPTWQLVSCRPF